MYCRLKGINMLCSENMHMIKSTSYNVTGHQLYGYDLLENVVECILLEISAIINQTKIG